MAKSGYLPYPSNMVFSMRLFPEPEGNARPRICALDWNRLSDDGLLQFRSMIAIGSISRTRIFAKLHEKINDKEWRMLYNICHLEPTRSKAIQWNPSNWKVLAVGTDDGEALTIEIVNWNGTRFRKANRIQVPTKHELVSLSWSNQGDYLVATLGPMNGIVSKMIVVKYPNKADWLSCIVDTGYKGLFSAVFSPVSNCIITCAEEVASLKLWIENESQTWVKHSSVKIGIGLRKLSFDPTGFLLAGIGSTLKIYDCTFDSAAAMKEPMLKLILKEKTEVDDHRKTYRGVSLDVHCSNLSSVHFGSNSMLLTGSSEGSMCLHGVPEHSTSQTLKIFKVQAFNHANVQFMDPKGEITCVQLEPSWDTRLLASGGTEGIVTIWEFILGRERPQVTRNPNLERYRYVPDHEKLNDSVCLEKDDAESIKSCATDEDDERELLLTVKSELGIIKQKQRRVRGMLDEANNGLKTGLGIVTNVAKGVGSVKVQNDEINTSIEHITQLLSFGL